MATVTVGISHGADSQALRTLAVALLATADELERVDLRTVDGVDALGWTGQDARTFRSTWDETHAVTLHLTAALLRRGAANVLDEAADQEEASGLTGSPGSPAAPSFTGSPVPGTGTAATGTPGTAGTPAEPSSWAALRDWAHARVDAFAELAQPTLEALGRVGTTVELAELGELRRRAGQAMDAAGAGAPLGGFGDLSIGRGTGIGLGVLGAIGTANDLHEAYHGALEGDLWRTTNGGVSGGLGIAGMVSSSPWVAGASVAWAVGSQFGEGINTHMEGTAFGDRFTNRMDAVFDVLGPAAPLGMIVTPGALIVTAGESITESVLDVVRDVGGLDGPAADPPAAGGGR